MREVEDRFWEKVQIGEEDECWPWVASTTRDGYGRFRYMGKMRTAHRVAYELSKGESPPDDKYVCHRCDNRPCCNPKHLFVGSASDNMIDMHQKSRHEIRKRKLSLEDAEQIRRFHASGARQIDIAHSFGISKSVVCEIIKGKVWSR